MRAAALGVVLAAASVASAAQPVLDREVGVVVESVYDGDTITVTVPWWPPILGDHLGVRVRGIDTPEMRASCDREWRLASRAREMVRGYLADADRVDLERISRGKYFRVVADVIAVVDGEPINISEALIASGLAVPYDGGTKTHDWCEEDRDEESHSDAER